MKPNLFQAGQIPHNLGERNAAKLRGEIRYFTGKACSKGHVAQRQVSNGRCIECSKEMMADRRSKRTEDQIAKDNAYALQNVKKWMEANKGSDCIKATKKRWKQKNIWAVRSNTAKRRAAKLHGTLPWLNSGHWFEIDSVYKYSSALRGIGLNYHVDHIVPLQGEMVSGLHTPWNLQVIHATENFSKGNKYYG